MPYDAAMPGDLDHGFVRVILGAEFLYPEVASPPVVVPSNEGHADARVAKGAKGVQGGKRRPWNHGAVGEPKFEQISGDDDVARHVREVVQKRVQPAAYGGAVAAEMRITKTHGGHQCHRRNLPCSLTFRLLD